MATYHGGFEDGQPHGQGTLTFANGSSLAAADWVRGRLDGAAVFRRHLQQEAHELELGCEDTVAVARAQAAGKAHLAPTVRLFARGAVLGEEAETMRHAKLQEDDGALQLQQRMPFVKEGGRTLTLRGMHEDDTLRRLAQEVERQELLPIAGSWKLRPEPVILSLGGVPALPSPRHMCPPSIATAVQTEQAGAAGRRLPLEEQDGYDSEEGYFTDEEGEGATTLAELGLRPGNAVRATVVDATVEGDLHWASAGALALSHLLRCHRDGGPAVTGTLTTVLTDEQKLANMVGQQMKVLSMEHDFEVSWAGVLTIEAGRPLDG
jgi:hypothetical protein